VDSWDLTSVATPRGTQSPVVLHSSNETRAVVIGLEPGQELGDHQVKEHAWILVVDGEIEIEAGAERVDGGPGTLAKFDPDERHAVRSRAGAKILLILAPWPGEGHYRGDPPAA
jgi:quercetin dioxygenase-like cupin family protein